MRGLKERIQAWWDESPCGSTTARAAPGTPDFFRQVEEYRYREERHIPEVARFDAHSGWRVLEVGCGLGTDLAHFAGHGARVVGTDLSSRSIELARARFRLEGLAGDFTVSDAEHLPFAPASFDHVYSHGVIHHTPDTEAAVREIHRVLRPQGTATVMVYHRDSYYYRINISILRRLGSWLLLKGLEPGLLARLAGEDLERVAAYAARLRQEGQLSSTLLLSMNTDGPGNPLSKVYSRGEMARLFSRFDSVRLEVRHLARRDIPLLGRLLPDSLDSWLGRRFGWFLYAHVHK